MKSMLLKDNRDSKLLSIIIRGETIRIPLDKIIYIESSGRKLLVHTGEETYTYNEQLGNLSELLEPEGFIRCHQSFLVNSSDITSIRYDELSVGELKIRISRKYRNNVINRSGMDQDISSDTRPGVITCIKGPYAGKEWKIVSEEKIIIGRSGSSSDLVICLPEISRKHLAIIFHSKQMKYEVMDMFSNGTYVEEGVRLEKNQRYMIEKDSIITLGDNVVSLRVG